MALILSLIYCGLGQIYKGEILKGVNFMLVYALLIVSFFFSHSSTFLVHFFHLLILILMWLMGGIDAYIDDRILIERERWLIWQRPLAILPAVVISGAIIILVVLWSQFFSPMNGRSVDDTNVEAVSGDYSLDNTKAETQFDNSDFFSVQVAAFRDSGKAESTCNELLLKGYSARIEYSESSGGNWYRVLIGRFHSEQEAISFAEKLYQEEELPYMIVHRPKTEAK